jgi:Putative DNA-binding domain
MTLQEQFDTLNLQDLDDFITNKQEEHLQLDFKTVKHASLNSTDDKKNFAEALSGFANSSGGLIVWGIDARKNADGIDCANSKKEIENLPLFLGRLNALTGEAVNPLISGVRHRKIPTNGDNGFAITIVPESETTPHMAKCGQNRYFKRSGDSFYQMEHFDLEDMFGRRKKPKLQVIAAVTPNPMTSNQGRIFRILVSLLNDGRGIAKAPYLELTFSSNWRVSPYGVDGNMNFNLPRIFSGNIPGRAQFGSTSNFVIHPNTQCDVTFLELTIASTYSADTSFEYGVTAEDSTLTRGTIDLKEDLSKYFPENPSEKVEKGVG